MKSIISLAFIFFAACGPPPEFVTDCGMELESPLPVVDPWDQTSSRKWASYEDVQKTETEILSVLATTAGDARFATACNRVRGYRLYVQSTAVFVSVEHGAISGLTDFNAGWAKLGNAPPDRGSLMHEMAHMIQRGDNLGLPCDARDDDLSDHSNGHCGWDKLGLWDKIHGYQHRD